MATWNREDGWRSSAPLHIPLGRVWVPPRRGDRTEVFLLPDGSGIVTVIGLTHEERGEAMSDFSDLDALQADYEPLTGGAQNPGPEILPDGSWEFEIVSAELTETPKTNETIGRIQLRVLSGPAAGRLLERATFFRRQEAVNYLGGELMSLGVETSRWADKSKPLSQHIEEAFVSIRGARFKGTKVTNTVNGKPYHNLSINSLVQAAPADSSASALPSPDDSPF
jgi:hypothetical protein